MKPHQMENGEEEGEEGERERMEGLGKEGGKKG